MAESGLTFHDENFCKFHVLYACTCDACVLETRRQFVTKTGKNEKESRNLKPAQKRLDNAFSFDTLACGKRTLSSR